MPPGLFIVDDEPCARHTVASLASSLRISCQAYASAEELLRAYDPSWAGCLLADFRLPGMNGLQLQEVLLALGCTLPVILVSGFVDVPTAVRAMQNGAITVLQKPCPAPALADAIQNGLSADAARRAAIRRRTMLCQRLAALTPRESQVMHLLVVGTPHKAIACRLGISLRTTARLSASVLEKMEVEATVDLARLLAETSIERPSGDVAAAHVHGVTLGPPAPHAARSQVPSD